jgi:YD repeat-containing protein
VTGATTVGADAANQIGSITDPLGHQTGFGYDDNVYSPDTYAHVVASGELTGVSFPEGNQVNYGYDGRANRTSSTASAKPNSGLANIGTSSSFPTTCTNATTCNKPSSTTDARGNVTSYSYDPTHGGVLTETGPADSNGISPVNRYTYAQRSAWLANVSGGYSASPYPVWLVTEMRTCRTTATVGSACAGGSSDEVVTTYDYGPDSGPNNLLLRGLVMTADGTSRRACYGYDHDGRKISEIKPNANLTACP